MSSRMTVLRDMIRPWVELDSQKLVTQEQFEQAMTTDVSPGIGGQPGTPTLPPGQPGVPPTIPPGQPGVPPTLPPGQPSQPGQPGGGGGGMNAAPGITPFLEGRVESVKAQLSAK
jgi:hypothetical protein